MVGLRFLALTLLLLLLMLLLLLVVKLHQHLLLPAGVRHDGQSIEKAMVLVPQKVVLL